MRYTWMVTVLLLFTAISIARMDSADGLEATLENDVFYISVDPSDDYQGVLEIHGEIDPGNLRITETITVTLSVAIHELLDGETTGRTWYSQVYFVGLMSGDEKTFRYNDGPESFVISTDYTDYNHATDEGIPVPEGLTVNYEGRVVLTVTYEGTGGIGSGEEILQATIYPELYHLVKLSVSETPVSMKASDRLTYSLSIRNIGNMVEIINVEVPVLEQLDEMGFETNLAVEQKVDVQPGESFISNLSIKAPNEIKRNDSYVIMIFVYTESEDPNTLEPASSTSAEIPLELKKSRIKQTGPIDDDDTTDDDDNPVVPGQDPMITDDEAKPWMVIVAIGFIMVILLIIILLIFRRRGDGDDPDEEIDQAHSSMVRI